MPFSCLQLATWRSIRYNEDSSGCCWLLVVSRTIWLFVLHDISRQSLIAKKVLRLFLEYVTHLRPKKKKTGIGCQGPPGKNPRPCSRPGWFSQCPQQGEYGINATTKTHKKCRSAPQGLALPGCESLV
jgi:hypothetical protein